MSSIENVLERFLLLISGDPGVGKTTLLMRIVRKLMSKGYIVGGVYSTEIREKGERKGFEIIDLTEGRKGLLASTEAKNGPRVGRYFVNLKDLKEIASDSIIKAVEKSEIIVIDEVGPMEIMSPEFKESVRKAVRSGKPLIVVVHARAKDDLIDELEKSASRKVYLTHENRERVAQELVETIK